MPSHIRLKSADAIHLQGAQLAELILQVVADHVGCHVSELRDTPTALRAHTDAYRWVARWLHPQPDDRDTPTFGEYARELYRRGSK